MREIEHKVRKAILEHEIDDYINRIQYDDNEETDEVAKRYVEVNRFFLAEEKNNETEEKYKWFIDDLNNSLSITKSCSLESKDRKREEKSPLTGYSQNYFNEIIQNANDAYKRSIRYHKEDFKDVKPEIVCIFRKDNNQYYVECSYPDYGFSLSDIYSFCLMNNSNKNMDDEYDGTFGIGIKSLFKFVDSFKLTSNFIICFNKREEILSIDINKDWIRKGRKTRLEISFNYTENTEISGGFNKRKLADFIDFLCGAKDEKNFEDYLLNGDKEELVFDARSMIFMSLQENSIQIIKMKSIDEQRSIEMGTKTRILFDNNTIIKAITFDQKIMCSYIIFKSIDNPIIAFPFNRNEKQERKDRLYSTYFIETYERDIDLLDDNSISSFRDEGFELLISTRDVGSARHTLAQKSLNDKSSKTKINKAINGAIKELLHYFIDTSIKLTNEKKAIISDVLCWVLSIIIKSERYNSNLCDPNREDDAIKLKGILNEIEVGQLFNAATNIVICTNDHMEHCFSEIGLSGCDDDIYEKKYIIRRNMKDDNEWEWIKENYQIDDTKYVYCELKRVFDEYIWKNDCIYGDDPEYRFVTSGIRALAELYLNPKDDEKKNTLFQLFDSYVPFVRNEKDLIRHRIGTNSEAFINDNVFSTTDRKYFRMLVARLEIDDKYNKNGEYNDAAVRELVFNFDSCANEIKEKFKDYDYKSLVDKLNIKNKYMYKKYNLDYYYWENFIDITCLDPDLKSNVKKLKDDEVIKLLELIDKDCLFLGYYKTYRKDYEKIVVHNMGKIIRIERIVPSIANKPCISDEYKTPIKFFDLSSIIEYHSFERLEKFAEACELLRKINKKCRYGMFCRYSLKCSIDEGNYNQYRRLFKWVYDNDWILKDDLKASNIGIYDIKFLIKANSSNDTQNDLAKNGFIETETVDLLEFVKSKYPSLNIGLYNLDGEIEGHRQFVGYIANVTGKNTGKDELIIRVKRSANANDDFKDISNNKPIYYVVNSIDIFSRGDNINKALSDTLRDLGIDNDILYYIDYFINTGSISTLSEEDFNSFVIKRKRMDNVYQYTDDEYEEYEKKYKTIDENTFDKNRLYQILSERHQYDIYCPGCYSIPTLNIKGENSGKMEKRNILISVIRATVNNDNENKRFVKMPLCKSCLEEYRRSLTSANINTKERKLELKCKYVSNSRSEVTKQSINFSPIHWSMIKRILE